MYIFPQHLIYGVHSCLLDVSLYVISNPESHRLTCRFLHSTEPVWVQDFRAQGSSGDCVMGNVPSFLNQQLKGILTPFLHGGHPVHSSFLVVFSTLECPGTRHDLYLARSADVSIKAGGQSGTNWVYMRASCSCATVPHKSIWSKNLGFFYRCEIKLVTYLFVIWQVC